MEEQPVNTILATLHATDADSTISEYQLIDSSGDNGNEYFEINNVTGKQKHSFYFIYLCVFLYVSLLAYNSVHTKKLGNKVFIVFAQNK
jgi:hypothetical protein